MSKFSVLLILFSIFLLFSCEEGSSPVDINQCENILCSNHGNCKVVNNNPTCECDTGYLVNGLNCEQDIDGICKDITCSDNGVCAIDSEKNAVCNCFSGYYSEGLECLKDNCDNVNCGKFGECIGRESSDTVTCKCDAGYYLEDMKCLKDNCIDLDCGEHGNCVNNHGVDAECVCDDDYYMKDGECLKDSCKDINCGTHQKCINKEDKTYECVCDTGYYMHDNTCLTDNCVGIDCGSGTCVNNNGVDYSCNCDDDSILYEGRCLINKPTCLIWSTDGENSPFEVEGNSKLNLISKSYYLDVNNTEDLVYEWKIIENPVEYYNPKWLFYPESDYLGALNADKHEVEMYIPYLTPDNTKYLAELTVTTTDGLTSTCTSEIKAVTNKGLYIELFWDKEHNDLDLHFLNPEDQDLNIDNVDDENDDDLEEWRERVVSEWWDNVPPHESDCHWENCKGDGIEWGESGVDDNPILLRDDIPGRGPEIIVLDKPSQSWYKTSVHVYSMAEPVNATIRVYCNGNLEYEKNSPLEDRDYTWLVNDIYWENLGNEGGVCHVFNENKVYTEKQGGVAGYNGDFVNNNCEEGYWGDNCDICAFEYHFDDSNNCVADEVCEENFCTDEHKSVCNIIDGIAICSCELGFHENSNSNCVLNEICDDTSCVENNKNRCNIEEGIVVCSCNYGMHEDLDGNCVANEVCEANTCMEANKSVCNVVDGLTVCSCDSRYHEDDNGVCVLDDICGMDELEPNFWNPYLPKKILNGEYNLKLCSGNSDVFLFYLNSGSILNVDLYFSDDNGNIDMRLYKENDRSQLIAYSQSSDDDESIEYISDESTFYVLRIYYIWGEPDEDQNYTMSISGISEYYDLLNNNLESSSLVVEPGETVLVNYGITSESFEELTQDIDYKIYLSEDSILDVSDTLIYSEILSNIVANEEIENSVNISFPQSLNLADYFLISKIDSENVITEINEDNNVITQKVRVLGNCSSDIMENNDSMQKADTKPLLTEGKYDNLTICSGDNDYYALDLTAGDNLYVNLYFNMKNNKDIDLKLIDSTGNTLIESLGLLDNEHINYNIVETGRYYIKVNGKTFNDENLYDLEILFPSCDNVCNNGTCEIINNGEVSCTCNDGYYNYENNCFITEMNTCPGSVLPVNHLLLGDTTSFENNYQAISAYTNNTANGNELVYQFTIDKLSKVEIKMSYLDVRWDMYLYLRSDCDNIDSQIAYSDNFGDTENIIKTLEPGTYYIFADGYNISSMGAYSIILNVDTICSDNSDCDLETERCDVNDGICVAN